MASAYSNAHSTAKYASSKAKFILSDRVLEMCKQRLTILNGLLTIVSSKDEGNAIQNYIKQKFSSLQLLHSSNQTKKHFEGLKENMDSRRKLANTLSMQYVTVIEKLVNINNYFTNKSNSTRSKNPTRPCLTSEQQQRSYHRTQLLPRKFRLRTRTVT